MLIVIRTAEYKEFAGVSYLANASDDPNTFNCLVLKVWLIVNKL